MSRRIAGGEGRWTAGVQARAAYPRSFGTRKLQASFALASGSEFTRRQSADYSNFTWRLPSR